MTDLFHIIITGDGRKARNFLFSKRKLKLTCFLTASFFIVLGILSNYLFHSFFPNSGINKQISQLHKQLQESNTLKEELALQIQTIQQEKDILLNTAVNELEEQSGLIERIMCNLGVNIKSVQKNVNPPGAGKENSGGPFIAVQKTNYKKLLSHSDHCLKAFRSVPLGRPIPGLVTSKFGRRTDPLNKRKGFHTGVDIRGRTGQKVMATADGVVTRSFINGSYGRYIEIQHSNGYTTKFAHLTKRLIKRGDKVVRGQVIGTVGSSGRSTGPHLHYEICLKNRPVNPSKFLRVDKLARAPVILKRKSKIKHQLIAENTRSTKTTSNL